MKKDIGTQVKCIHHPVFRNIPTGRQRRNNMQTVIDLYKGIEQLMSRPHGSLAFGKCRIQGGNTGELIIVKYILFLPGFIITGDKKSASQ